MKQEILKLCNELIDNKGDIAISDFNNGYDTLCGDLSSTNIVDIAFNYIAQHENKKTYSKKQSTDNINNPSHYNKGKIEVIEVIEDWKLGFNLGNAIKYIGRCEHKNNKSEDIKKAIWYLERELNNDK